MLDKRSGPATGPLRKVPPASVTTGIVPDPGVRLAARERIWAQHRRRRVSGELEGLAPLGRYYGPRRPRPVPLARFLAEGWWAA